MRTEGEVEFVAEARETARREREVRVSWMVAAPVALGLVVVGVAAARFLMGPGYGTQAGPGGIPIIEPDPTPTKTKPENPGGMEVPNQDKLVYERLRNAKFEPSVERLLPPEEEPLPRPVVVPKVPDPTILSRPQLAAPIQAPEPPPAPAPVASPAPAPVVIAPVPADKGAPSVPPATKPPPVVSVPPAAVPPKPAALPAAAPASAPPPTPAPTLAPKPAGAASGGWRVQLASVRTEEEARSEIRRLASKVAPTLGGAALEIARADLGDKGIYYRVRGGGMEEAAAREACRGLQAQGVGCVVVRP